MEANRLGPGHQRLVLCDVALKEVLRVHLEAFNGGRQAAALGYRLFLHLSILAGQPQLLAVHALLLGLGGALGC